MNDGPISIAVVGHTNTGKTSLMRTLLRDPEFGEVSDRPGVTKRVEGASLLMDGRPLLELFDTPGLEDSIGLLDAVDRRQSDRSTPPREVITNYLDSDDARSRFRQEAAVLRQVLESDLVLYVIDARDRVLGKHRDELEILRRCARPVVPVLNFIEGEHARLDEWRRELAHAGLHAVAEFDTVVYDAVDEERLFEKWRTLLDDSDRVVDALLRSRREERERLICDSLRIIADLLIDVASFVRVIPVKQATEESDDVRSFRDAVRDREQRCVRQLLDLHGFDPAYWKGDDLPIDDGRWGMDLFSPEALRQFGIRTGSAAGAGALAGLAVDALLGGLSFGAAAATGAAIGAIWSTAASHGRRLLDRTRGLSEMRCNRSTLTLLEARALSLLRALLSRGHASQRPIGNAAAANPKAPPARETKSLLTRASAHPDWSSLNDPKRHRESSPSRDQLSRRLADQLRASVAPREIKS